MNKDLTDKELLAMGKKTPKVKKRVLFKDYCGTYMNLGMANRDSKTIKKELTAIAKRGTVLIMKDILKKTVMPKKFPEYQQPLITVIIYAGIMDDTKGVIYPEPTDEYRLEEV